MIEFTSSELEFLSACLPEPGLLCLRCAKLWELLASRPQTPPRVDEAALSLGFRNRQHFARWLARHGHPSYQDLRDTSQVLWWLAVAERGGPALAQQAYNVGKEPSVCYRTVSRVTGAGWAQLRKIGAGVLRNQARQAALRARCCRGNADPAAGGRNPADQWRGIAPASPAKACFSQQR